MKWTSWVEGRECDPHRSPQPMLTVVHPQTLTDHCQSCVLLGALNLNAKAVISMCGRVPWAKGSPMVLA